MYDLSTVKAITLSESNILDLITLLSDRISGYNSNIKNEKDWIDDVSKWKDSDDGINKRFIAYSMEEIERIEIEKNRFLEIKQNIEKSYYGVELFSQIHSISP